MCGLVALMRTYAEHFRPNRYIFLDGNLPLMHDSNADNYHERRKKENAIDALEKHKNRNEPDSCRDSHELIVITHKALWDYTLPHRSRMKAAVLSSRRITTLREGRPIFLTLTICYSVTAHFSPSLIAYQYAWTGSGVSSKRRFHPLSVWFLHLVHILNKQNWFGRTPMRSRLFLTSS